MKRVVPVLLLTVSVACGSSKSSGFDADGGSSGSSGTPGPFVPGAGDASTPGTDGGTVETSIIYANTDDSLYSLDPATNALTLVGAFSGQGSNNVTDCAVNAAGEVYVNTATDIFKATLPAGGTGGVTLNKVASIAVKSNQSFFALAFAPVGVLGAGEGLVGGDDHGELWSIDPATGATKDLGSFGPDGSKVFALSGDIVFYLDAGKPTGVATVRSCASGGGSCTATDDYLVGIDMTALANAFTSGTRASSLRGGIYGGSTSSKGPGILHGDVFGLGAWKGTVYGFERSSANSGTPALLTIDTTTGAGTIVPQTVKFTNGWSGACVTTSVSVTIPPPPAGPN